MILKQTKWIMLISVILLAGCVPQQALEDNYAKPQEAEPITAEPAEKLPSESAENIVETPDKSTDEKAEGKKQEQTKNVLRQGDIIKIKTYGDYSEVVNAVIYGEKMDGFRMEYTDRDAILFDIKKNYALTLEQARLLTVIDELPYLNEQEKAELKQHVAVEEADVNITSEIIYSVGYSKEKDSGFLRAVGCDLETKTLIFKLQNIEDKTARIYRNIKPVPENSVYIALNRKSIPNFACLDNKEEMPEYGDTVQCYSQPVKLMKNEGIDRMDEIALTKPGHSELLKFECG